MIFRFFSVNTMNRICRALLFVLPCFVFVAFCAVLASAGDDVVWPQHPIRIDRSKQHYERLPALQQNIDRRIWLMVPDRVTIGDSAHFSFGGKSYRIAMVRPVGIKRICKDADAGRWLCGRQAAILLGNLVRGKRLLCDVIYGEKETTLSRCLSGKTDIAGEVVAEGFGQAESGSPLKEAEERARASRLGVWRNPDCIDDFDHC